LAEGVWEMVSEVWKAWKFECLQEMPWIAGLSLVETRVGNTG
jgi:hypothetical protein